MGLTPCDSQRLQLSVLSVRAQDAVCGWVSGHEAAAGRGASREIPGRATPGPGPGLQGVAEGRAAGRAQQAAVRGEGFEVSGCRPDPRGHPRAQAALRPSVQDTLPVTFWGHSSGSRNWTAGVPRAANILLEVRLQDGKGAPRQALLLEEG